MKKIIVISSILLAGCLGLNLFGQQQVKAYLVAAGIEAGRLQTKGFGSAKPVADNASELGRAQNRRVELVRQ